MSEQKVMKKEMLEQLKGWREYCVQGEGEARGCKETCGIIHMEKCLKIYQDITSLIENMDRGPKVDKIYRAYQKGIIMMIRHDADIAEKWREYRGAQTFGEFALKYMKPFYEPDEKLGHEVEGEGNDGK